MAVQTYWNDYDATLPSSARSAGQPQRDPMRPMAVRPDCRASRQSGDAATTPGAALDLGPDGLRQHEEQGHHVLPVGSRLPMTHNPAVPTSICSYWWKYAVDKAWNDDQLKAQKEGDFSYNADQIMLSSETVSTPVTRAVSRTASRSTWPTSTATSRPSASSTAPRTMHPSRTMAIPPRPSASRSTTTSTSRPPKGAARRDWDGDGDSAIPSPATRPLLARRLR